MDLPAFRCQLEAPQPIFLQIIIESQKAAQNMRSQSPALCQQPYTKVSKEAHKNVQ